MYSEIRTDYEKFKASNLAIQVLRVSNAFIGSFTFWNVAFGVRHTGHFAWRELSPFLIGASLLVGVVIAGLTVLKLSTRQHLVFLPILVFGFIVSSDRNFLGGLILIPCAVIVYLLMVRAIIRMGNYVNRV